MAVQTARVVVQSLSAVLHRVRRFRATTAATHGLRQKISPLLQRCRLKLAGPSTRDAGAPTVGQSVGQGNSKDGQCWPDAARAQVWVWSVARAGRARERPSAGKCGWRQAAPRSAPVFRSVSGPFYAPLLALVFRAAIWAYSSRSVLLIRSRKAACGLCPSYRILCTALVRGASTPSFSAMS